MDLFSTKIIKELLAKGTRGASLRSAGTPRSGARDRQAVGVRPLKGLGQNFLISQGVLNDILKAANLKRSDTVLEIGPGIGTLTRELAKNVKRVIAVEKDSAMVEILKETTKDLQNIEIIQGDILKNEIRNSKFEIRNPSTSSGSRAKSREKSKAPNPKYKILNTRYKVVANLPYYITSPVIRKFLEVDQKPELMVLMVQKEVAQRICAKPRTRPPMNLLAVSVQFYAKPEVVSYAKKSCFWPQPKVDSAILKIVPHKELRQNFHDREKFVGTFFRVVKAGFKQPRKQLLHNLVHELPPLLDAWRLTSDEKRARIEQWLKKNGVDPTQRAETLTLQDWIKLAKSAIIEA